MLQKICDVLKITQLHSRIPNLKVSHISRSEHSGESAKTEFSKLLFVTV